MKPFDKYSVRRHIGKLLKQHRIKQKLSQQELAKILGIDRQYIWNIENGRVNLSLDYLENIMEKLKCTQDDFFKNSDI